MRLLQLGLRVGLALTASVLVPACGGAEQPAASLPPASESPPASAVPSTAATPSATPVTGGPTPGQFDAATQAEAEQFVRDWWAAVNDTRGGEATAISRLRDFYVPECSLCETYVTDANAFALRGQRVEGAEQRLLHLSYRTNEGRVALVEATVQSQPGRLVDAGGKIASSYSGGDPIQFVFNIVQQPDRGWMIYDILRLGK